MLWHNFIGKKVNLCDEIKYRNTPGLLSLYIRSDIYVGGSSRDEKSFSNNFFTEWVTLNHVIIYKHRQPSFTSSGLSLFGCSWIQSWLVSVFSRDLWWDMYDINYTFPIIFFVFFHQELKRKLNRPPPSGGEEKFSSYTDCEALLDGLSEASSANQQTEDGSDSEIDIISTGL